MILYHGSPNNFEVFDYSRIRTNGTSEGIGFYFTTSEKIARSYMNGGYLYTVEFNGRKPLSDNRLTLTKEEAELIIRHLDDKIQLLTNYGDVPYEGYQNVLKTALELEYDNAETDSDFMGSLYNSCGEDSEVILAFHDVLGYDHIVSKPEWGGGQVIYVALTNDSIKIIKKEKGAVSA